jgi:hypothetical protein
MPRSLSHTPRLVIVLTSAGCGAVAPEGEARWSDVLSLVAK